MHTCRYMRSKNKAFIMNKTIDQLFLHCSCKHTIKLPAINRDIDNFWTAKVGVKHQSINRQFLIVRNLFA
jgi:hypothetical protein